MAYLHSGKFFWKGYLKREYLYNLEKARGDYEPCNVVGVWVQQNRALGFDVLLSNGALIAKLPISALCTRPKAESLHYSAHTELGILQMWDCMGSQFELTEIQRLKRSNVEVFLNNRRSYSGSYLFTIVYAAKESSFDSYAEEPSELKTHNVIALDNGRLCAYPNNRIKWLDTTFVEGWKQRPDYLVNRQEWFAEDGHKWKIKDEKEDRLFYKVSDNE